MKFKLFSEEAANSEASKMKEKITSGKANNYKEADILVENEKGELSFERAKQLTKIFSEGGWMRKGFVEFLDSINDAEELEAVRSFIIKNNLKIERGDAGLFDYYQENLEKWPNPEQELPKSFEQLFPLVTQKLDSPQKKRIFLRCAAWTEASPEDLAKMAEEILKEHEIRGLNVVSFNDDGHGKYGRFSKEMDLICVLAYFTQLPPHSLRKILFPDLKNSGTGTKEGVYFSWEDAETKEKK